MSKHTPGPWIYWESEGWIVKEDKGKPLTSLSKICEVWDHREGALIAAAPEMLEALKTLSLVFHGYLTPEETKSLCDVINKAEGKV